MPTTTASARQALEAFDHSRIPDGITRSRYPSSLPQTIPTFSLLWIGMLHDYWMYRPDPEPVRASLPGTRDVLELVRARTSSPTACSALCPGGASLTGSPPANIPTYDANGESCITTLEYLGALDDAADLEKSLGDPLFATRYRDRAAHVRSGLHDKCWNASRGLVADNPDQKVFSQQANILAVLYDVVPKDQQQDVLRKMLAIEPGTTPDGVLSASYYFRFYLARALDHAGLADEYLAPSIPGANCCRFTSAPGLRFPATPAPTRHAWSAHPIYDLLTLVAGIEPASPGFATVRIAPHLGTLDAITASFPHPQGAIALEYHRQGAALDANITLPGNLAGTFVLHGKVYPLKPGANHIHAE